MTINRRLLYAGVFLIAAGTVVLVVQGGDVDRDVVRQALGLWPVAVIALGVGLLVRRTSLATPGGMVAAAMPGLLLGGMLVAPPEIGWECRDLRPVALAARDGTFSAGARVNLRLFCGDLTVTTAPGSGWRLDSGNGRGPDATVDSSADRLTITSAHLGRGFARGSDVWRLALPTATTIDLQAEIDAGSGTFDLAGARLGTVDLTVDAGDVHVDLARAALQRLSLHVNGGAASIGLPADQDLVADLSANAGALRICAPGELGLRVHQDGVLAGTTFPGLVRTGGAWETPGYAMAIHHADVTVSVNVGSVDVNPIGGCR